MADSAFVPSLPSATNALNVLPDGKILVGHGSGVSLLNADGTPASGFSYAGSAAAVNAILPVPSGSGDFLLGRVGGVIRITASGTLVTPFPATGAGAIGSVTELLALPSGNVIAAGAFTTYGGTTVNRIVHLNPNGVIAPGFDFGTGSSAGFGTTGALVYGLALGADGNLWVGGSFTTYRGSSRRKLACLTTDVVISPDPGAPAPDAYTQYLIAAGIPAARRGTADDPDGDGSTNLDEFQNGTHPGNIVSVAFRLTTTGVGATVTANPTSANGVYEPGPSVALTATPTAGSTFAGWLADGASTPDLTNPLTVVMSQNRTVTAYAGLPLGEALDAPSFTWTTGGNRLWTGVTSPSQDGVDAVAVSGLASPSQEAWFETTVAPPGVLSLRWKLTTAVPDGAILQILANGSSLALLPATAGTFNPFAVNLSGSTPTTVRVRLVANFNGGVTLADSAGIDRFSFGPFTAPALLTPTDLTQTGVTLNWSASGGASGYYLDVATNAAFTAGLRAFSLGIDQLSQAVGSLVTGTTYYYRVTAQGTSSLTATSVTGSFVTGAQQSQTLDFPPPAAQTFGDAPFALAATASSGLPVAFAVVSGPANVVGGLLTLTGAGDVVIRATQAGDASFFAAPPVESAPSPWPAPRRASRSRRRPLIRPTPRPFSL